MLRDGKIYRFAEDVEYTAAGESALKVANSATVTLEVPADVTVTLKGGDATGGNAADGAAGGKGKRDGGCGGDRLIVMAFAQMGAEVARNWVPRVQAILNAADHLASGIVLMRRPTRSWGRKHVMAGAKYGII